MRGPIDEKANPTIVDTIKGYYDEESKAILYDINDRKFCLHHKFINASLKWETPDSADGRCYYSINLEAEKKEGFSPEWGMGYGGIRFCERCKIIDCIHLWKYQITYEIRVNNYYSRFYLVKTCKICGRRILISGWGDYRKVKPEAVDLIGKIAAEYGKKYDELPSGYLCELPMQVSIIMDEGGDAEAHVRQAFIHGVVMR